MANQVEIHPVQDAVVLRRSGSELLILASHVTELKTRKSAKEFSDYFMNEALVNRPARKLFENWLRKEGDLWRRVYQSVQAIEQSAEAKEPAEESTPVKAVAAKAESKSPTKKTEKTSAKDADIAPEKKSEKKPVPKKATGKVDPKKSPTKADKKVAAPKKSAGGKTAAPARKAGAARSSKKS